MRIWLINSAEATPLDEGEVRLRRTAILARALVDHGHEVLWWNADFFHATKKHRFGEDRTVELEPRYTIRFLHGPGYRKHISFARFWDHRMIARRFHRFAESVVKPDIILCSLPTLDLADAATRYGKKNGVPVVLDIRDLWPDVIAESVSRPIQPLANLCLSPYHLMARRACRLAVAFTGNTPKFVEWGLAKTNRIRTPFDKDFPFGYEEPAMTQEEIAETDAFWIDKGLKINFGIPVVAYIGVIGQNFQDEVIIRAADAIRCRKESQFVICGGGDRLEELRNKYGGRPDILFPGWVNAKQIWRLMNHASIALASYKESENYRSSLTNKTIEYMAGGLPILFSIDDGYVAELIRDNEIGLTYGGSADRLAESILRLLDDEPYRTKLSQNAKNLYLEKYQSDAVYAAMAEHLEKIAERSSNAQTMF